MKETLDNKAIDMLRDLPDMIPVFRQFYESWNIRVFNRKLHDCRNYLSPNRRDFYKILMVTKGKGVFTLGLNTYHIDQPTMIYIHPNDIISWRNLTSEEEAGGYYVLFKKDFVNSYPSLKTTIEKLGLFTDKNKSIISLEESVLPIFNTLFDNMQNEEQRKSDFGNEAIVAYLQLIMVESLRAANFIKADSVSEDYQHIHKFFDLLETETSNINYSNPIKLRTAKEFASIMDLHPNYLNRLLKKNTGQNVSTHIRNRILEESKILLLHTSWSLNDISYSIGFSDQPNFNLFFKKNTGFTPSEFRKIPQ